MSEAQRLADSISQMDTFTEYQRGEILEAAAELRRLDAVNARMLKELELIANPVDAALDPKRAVRVSRAAIAATGGTT